MNKIIIITILSFLVNTNITATNKVDKYNVSFLKVSGRDIVKEDGSKHFIKGTNLGNWLNPEGYMFGFNSTNSPRKINEMLC